MAHRFDQINPEHCYTKQEVDRLIKEAIDEAMRKHNRDATIISAILGSICLALFLDGTLRLLGIIPPFMDIDISIINKIVDLVRENT